MMEDFYGDFKHVIEHFSLLFLLSMFLFVFSSLFGYMFSYMPCLEMKLFKCGTVYEKYKKKIEENLCSNHTQHDFLMNFVLQREIFL